MATPSGKQTIGSLAVGDTVLAYNLATGKREPEPVQHVWRNHDHDLVDVKLTTSAPGAASRASSAASGTKQASSTTTARLSRWARRGALVAGLAATLLTTAACPIEHDQFGWTRADRIGERLQFDGEELNVHICREMPHRPPYGGVRYQSGTLPTDHGFTGQVSDAATSGLDYYGARYYDPVAGQFTSADTTLAGGLNRYAYVGGNPETFNDPSGHDLGVIDDRVGGKDVGYGNDVGGGGVVTEPPPTTSSDTGDVTAPPLPPNVPGSVGGRTTLWIIIGLFVLSVGAALYMGGQGIWQAWQRLTAHGSATGSSASTHYAIHQTNALTGENDSTPPTPPTPPEITSVHTSSSVDEGSAPQPATGGAGAASGNGGGDRCGCWLYHGSQYKFDQFDVEDAIAQQTGKRLELGLGIYFTDEQARAYAYAGGNKNFSYMYRAWIPQSLLDQLPTSIISTNSSRQWVVNNQDVADVLNQTIERITAANWWVNNPWKDSPNGC